MRTRQRAKGRRGREAERFAAIPVSVLESEAVTTLGHAAFRVLVILASQYWGGNNGALALTERYARPHGFRGRDTLYRSLRELETRGLIVCTRRGMKMKRSFTLYALGWRDIDNRDGKPLDVPEPRNNLRWLHWRQSAAPPSSSKAEFHTDSWESLVPMAGSEAAVSVPMAATSEAVSVPAIGNTLRVSPHSASERVGDASASAVRVSDSKVRRLLTELPNLTDSEVARMLSVDVGHVQTIRESQVPTLAK
jgi:hypothetical protein